MISNLQESRFLSYAWWTSQAANIGYLPEIENENKNGGERQSMAILYALTRSAQFFEKVQRQTHGTKPCRAAVPLFRAPIRLWRTHRKCMDNGQSSQLGRALSQHGDIWRTDASGRLNVKDAPTQCRSVERGEAARCLRQWVYTLHSHYCPIFRGKYTLIQIGYRAMCWCLFGSAWVAVAASKRRLCKAQW